MFIVLSCSFSLSLSLLFSSPSAQHPALPSISWPLPDDGSRMLSQYRPCRKMIRISETGETRDRLCRRVPRDGCVIDVCHYVLSAVNMRGLDKAYLMGMLQLYFTFVH